VNIFITGANGFIGQYVVDEALAQGHFVIAFTRSQVPQQWSGLPNLRIVRGDLRSVETVESALSGADVVIHLAAVMSGDSETQYSDTLQATRILLRAMDHANMLYLIGLSSISVLDYIDQSPMSVIDEKIPVNNLDGTMGSYALMKRDQERILDEWAAGKDKHLATIRPGIVYDDKHLSDAHVGFIKGGKGLAAMHSGQVPVVYVKNLAQALTALAGTDFQTEVIHLVNDELPTQADYLKALTNVNAKLKGLKRISWITYSKIAGFIRFSLWLIGQSKKVPDSFRESSVAGRLKPLRFSNSYAREQLGWRASKGLYTDSGTLSK